MTVNILLLTMAGPGRADAFAICSVLQLVENSGCEGRELGSILHIPIIPPISSPQPPVPCLSLPLIVGNNKYTIS